MAAGVAALNASEYQLKKSKKVPNPCGVIRIGKMGKQCAKLKWLVSKIMILRVVFGKNSKGKYIK